MNRQIRSLYSMERGVWIELITDSNDIKIPPGAAAPPRVVFFEHIDGMYSLCQTPTGQYVHPAAWTKARKVDKPEDATI